MNIHDSLSDIHSLEEELISFERKFGIRSETFYTAYINREEPDDDGWTLDCSEWASVYKTWLERQADYRNKIQRVPKKSSSLSGLIRVEE